VISGLKIDPKTIGGHYGVTCVGIGSFPQIFRGDLNVQQPRL